MNGPLPDVDEVGYDEYHNQLFQEDADRKIHSLALAQTTNDRLADLNRIGSWAASEYQQPAPVSPPPSEPAAPEPAPTPEPSPPEPMPAPEPSLAAPPAAPTPVAPAATPAASPVSTPAGTDDDWLQSAFGAAVSAGADVGKFVSGLGQGSGDRTMDAMNAVLQAGGDVDQFLQNLRPTGPPASAPTRSPASGGPTPGGQIDASSHTSFVQSMQPYAEKWAGITGIPASYLTAWAASESNWGKAGNALFGIKEGSQPGTAPGLTSATWEQGQGATTDTFANYNSPDEAFASLDQFLQGRRYQPIYQQLRSGQISPDQFMQGINAAGYATDPVWGKKIGQIADQSIAPLMQLTGARPAWQQVAESQLGKPYIWGSGSGAGGRGTGDIDPSTGMPVGFDCSGFVSYVYKNALGIDLPAQTASAYAATKPVDLRQAQAGDVVLYNMDNPDPHVQHIAIYMGDGKVIQAGGSAATRNVNIAPIATAGTYEIRRANGADVALNNQKAAVTVADDLHPLTPPPEGANPSSFLDRTRETLTQSLRDPDSASVLPERSSVFSDTSDIFNSPMMQAASAGAPQALPEAPKNPLEEMGSNIANAVTSGLKNLGLGGSPDTSQTAVMQPIPSDTLTNPLGTGNGPQDSARLTGQPAGDIAPPQPPLLNRLSGALGIDERQAQIAENQKYLQQQRAEAAPSGPLENAAFDVGRGAEFGAAESRVEMAADVRAGDALATSVIDQAKAAGWQPTPDQEEVAHTVLSQVTPMNTLLAVAGAPGGGLVGGPTRAAARALVESALGYGLNIAGTTVASELAQNADLPGPLQFGAGLLGGMAAQLTGHGTVAGATRAAEYLRTPEGQAMLRTRQRAQFSLDPEGAARAEAARVAGVPKTGEGMLADAFEQLKAYPEDTAGPIRAWASSADAPASDIARTVQRWMAENPQPEARVAPVAEAAGVEPAPTTEAPQAAVGGLPPVAAGLVRLFRGEPLLESRQQATEGSRLGRWFTPDADVAREFADDQFGPGMSRTMYVDVPKSVVETTGVLSSTGEFGHILSSELANRASPVPRTNEAASRVVDETRPAGSAQAGPEPNAARVADLVAQAGGDTETAQNLSRRINYDDLAEIRRQETPPPPPPPEPSSPEYEDWVQNRGKWAPATASLSDRIQGFLSSNMLVGPHSLETNAASQSEQLLRAPAIRALAGYPSEAWTGLRMLAAATNDAYNGSMDVIGTGRVRDPVEALTHAPIGWEAPGVRGNAAMDEGFRTWGRAQGMGMEMAQVMAEHPELSKAEVMSQYGARINDAGQKAGATSVYADGPSQSLGAQASGLRTRLINDPDPKKKLMGWALYAAMPFSRIPERIWTTGIARSSPINELLGSAKMIQAARKGDWRGVRLAGAETMIDSTLNLIILNQAINGNITAKDDPEHPWSIRLPGDKWLDYRSLGPVATRMGAMASIVEANREQSNKLKPNVLVDIMDKTAGMTLNQWFLGPTVGVLDLMRTGNFSGAGSKFLTQLGDRVLPAGALSNYIEKSTDPMLRDPSKELPDALWERQQSRIPGLAGALPAKISTTTGEPMANPQAGTLGLLDTFAGLENEVPDPVRKELADLDRRLNYSVAPPPEDTRSFTLAGSEIPLTNDERRIYLAARGHFLSDRLKQYEKQYEGWTDDAKARFWQDMLGKSGEAGKAELVNKTWGGLQSPVTQQKIREGHKVVGRLEPLPEPTPTPSRR